MKPPIQIDDPLLPPRDAAALLGIETKTLGRWRREGRIKAVPLPTGHVRYRRSVIDAILGGATADVHQPVRVPGLGLQCERCSRAKGEPVAWPCGAGRADV